VTDLAAHHYGVTVTDLETAVAFYRDTLGLGVLDRFFVSGEAFATGVGVPGATGSFAHLDAFYAGLPADVETISEPQTTASGTRICFFRDPDGNLVEVLEG
jgi:catechol 2,3-dioxygenase-like lactoylglutathione lyase family enzyme